jgi:SAM-dependent methyltransferase
MEPSPDQQALDHVQMLPQDVDNFSDDSGYDEGAFSTASVASSIYHYEQENGRSYHAFRNDKKYALPNDEQEQERMDITYHSVRLAMEEKHWHCPLLRPDHILDVGTGTGIWAIDVADDYPDARVIGVDLSPIQPTAVPPNLEFQVMDGDEEWTFSERFDFVHTRLMNGFSIKSWDFFYDQAWKCLEPGGWVENQEFDLCFRSDDDTVPTNSAVKEWEALWEGGIQKFGLTGRCYPDQMKRKMEARGFINCHVKPFKIPVGPWPQDKQLRQSGLFLLVSLLEGVSGLSVRVFTNALGWSVEELEVFLLGVKKEWRKKTIHSFLPMCRFLPDV